MKFHMPFTTNKILDHLHFHIFQNIPNHWQVVFVYLWTPRPSSSSRTHKNFHIAPINVSLRFVWNPDSVWHLLKSFELIWKSLILLLVINESCWSLCPLWQAWVIIIKYTLIFLKYLKSFVRAYVLYEHFKWRLYVETWSPERRFREENNVLKTCREGFSLFSFGANLTLTSELWVRHKWHCSSWFSVH